MRVSSILVVQLPILSTSYVSHMFNILIVRLKRIFLLTSDVRHYTNSLGFQIFSIFYSILIFLSVYKNLLKTFANTINHALNISFIKIFCKRQKLFCYFCHNQGDNTNHFCYTNDVTVEYSEVFLIYPKSSFFWQRDFKLDQERSGVRKCHKKIKIF